MAFIQERLKIYTPYLFKLIEGQDIAWKDINKNFTIDFEENKRKFFENGGYLKVEMTFYQLISSALNNRAEAIHLFIYINVVFKGLAEHLSEPQRRMVGTIVRNLLKNFTLDYMNSLGELFVLNKLIITGSYRLDNVEYKMSNGKRVDFNLYSYELKRNQFVEIVNIRLDASKLESDTSIKNYLLKKFWDKISNQTRKFTSDFDFLVVPVLWGAAKDLEKVSKFYKNANSIQIHGVAEPFAYCCWADELGENTRYEFDRISELFD